MPQALLPAWQVASFTHTTTWAWAWASFAAHACTSLTSIACTRLAAHACIRLAAHTCIRQHMHQAGSTCIHQAGSTCMHQAGRPGWQHMHTPGWQHMHAPGWQHMHASGWQHMHAPGTSLVSHHSVAEQAPQVPPPVPLSKQRVGDCHQTWLLAGWQGIQEQFLDPLGHAPTSHAPLGSALFRIFPPPHSPTYARASNPVQPVSRRPRPDLAWLRMDRPGHCTSPT